MMKWLSRHVASAAALFLVAFWQMFFSTRPALTTEPATLAGNGDE